MKIEFDVKFAAKDLYLFNMYQAYRGLQGIVSIVLPILIFAYTAYNWNNVELETSILNIGIGVVFFTYVPVSLWLRSAKTVKTNEVLSKPLHYEFSEDAIRVSQEEESAEFQWENIYRMITLGDMVLIYTNRINAYIIPKKQIVEEYAALKELAKSKLEKYRIKMK